MRLFIALPLDDPARAAVSAYQDGLRALGLRGSFTRPENLHLTLAFLGEQPGSEQAIEAMEAVSFSGPLTFLLNRPGRFSQPDGPLLWLAPEQDGALKRLAKLVDSQLRMRGFELEERPFQAHLTFCRRVKNPELLPRLPEASVPVRAEGFTLYHSHMENGLLTYTPLYTQPFGRKEA